MLTIGGLSAPCATPAADRRVEAKGDEGAEQADGQGQQGLGVSGGRDLERGGTDGADRPPGCSSSRKGPPAGPSPAEAVATSISSRRKVRGGAADEQADHAEHQRAEGQGLGQHHGQFGDDARRPGTSPPPERREGNGP